jgi:3-hydroxyacyl-CoA dehydrogenase
MDISTEINRVAIVGTGLIGSSWAACFLAHGLDVVATDPAPGTEDKLRQYVETVWAALTKFGLAPGASISRLRFESDLEEALAGVGMVQENAPEREPLKIKLFAEIDSILPPPAILVSSTSGIPMSRIQSECKHPERCVTGHPFNPPHLIPLVEVVGVLEEVDGRSIETLSQERDTLIMGLLELLSHRGKTKPVAASGHTADNS